MDNQNNHIFKVYGADFYSSRGIFTTIFIPYKSYNIGLLQSCSTGQRKLVDLHNKGNVEQGTCSK